MYLLFPLAVAHRRGRYEIAALGIGREACVRTIAAVPYSHCDSLPAR